MAQDCANWTKIFKRPLLVCENGGTLNASLGGCSCVAGFAGLQCERLIYDCKEGEDLDYPSGVYDIKPPNAPVSFNVRCWMEWGGRTYLTLRQSNSLLFNRTWQEYKNGFGNLQGDHWLGLQQIYYLTNSGLAYELLVQVNRKENGVYLQQYYSNFKISNEASYYRLSFSSSSPNEDPAKTLGDSLSSALGSRFSTYDADHDDDDTKNCALRHQSGWWFPSPCNLTEGNPLGRLARPDDEVWSGKSEDVFWLNDLGTVAPWTFGMWLFR
ncbi:fibrinogen-like protein 1 [Littorina saxatilis]|uniref:fibrinogen-like protein 1 n=1 Tax=Littorina saxatilis TaxID=31220 RepID=UPI0038B46941